MATIVCYNGYRRENGNYQYYFGVVNPCRMSLIVQSFKDGIVDVYPTGTILELAEVLAGCFDENSNFFKEVFRVYGYDHTEELKGIRYETNLGGTASEPVFFLVTKENANKEKILEEWMSAYEEALKKGRCAWKEYEKTSEYKEKRAKQLKREARAKVVEQKVVCIDETTQMEFKDKKAAEEWAKLEASSNSYTRVVMIHARRWAKHMQHLMKKQNKSVAEIAERASWYTSIDQTGFSHGMAVWILSRFWKHGEELRKWHNRPFGYEGDGVVNPAVC